VAVATAVLFGTAPALRATRVQPNDALKAQGRGVVGEGRWSLGNALVVMQVALSLTLLVAAGLFVRTFTSLATRDLGFERQGVMVVSINAQRAQLEPADRPALFQRVLDAARGVPGVASVALSAVTPISGSTWNNRIDLPDGPDLPEKERITYINLISGDWFRSYATPVLAGRDITDQDTATSQPVVIVNETFAKKFVPGRSPVGARIRQPGFGPRPSIDREIVGVVRDAAYRSLRDPVPPTMYIPFAQEREPPSSLSLSVRSAGPSPVLLTRSLADALTPVHRDLAMSFRPLAEQVDAALTQERLVAMLSGFFGGLALLLAALGLYGVTSYAVSRRRTEIGIRMALGADQRGVIALVLRRVGMLVALGVVLGLSVSLWASRFVSTLLFGLEPRDPGTLVAAALVLGAIGALAGWLPARRASRIDPARVLRDG
jgi:predicted permease